MTVSYFFNLWWRNLKGTASKGFSLFPNHTKLNFCLGVGSLLLFPLTLIIPPFFKTIGDCLSRFNQYIPTSKLDSTKNDCSTTKAQAFDLNSAQQKLASMNAEDFDELVQHAETKVTKPKSNSSRVMMEAMKAYNGLGTEEAREEIRQNLNSQMRDFLVDEKNNGKNLLFTLFNRIKYSHDQLALTINNSKSQETRFGI